MKEDNEFQSHAWIEHKESIILNDLPNIEKFKKFTFMNKYQVNLIK